MEIRWDLWMPIPVHSCWKGVKCGNLDPMDFYHCVQLPGSAPTWFAALHLIVFSARPQQRLWWRWPDDMMTDCRFQSSQQHTYILGGWPTSHVCRSVSVCGLCILMNVREEDKQIETSHSRLSFSLALWLLIIKVKLDRQRPWPASGLSEYFLKHFKSELVSNFLQRFKFSFFCSHMHLQKFTHLQLNIRKEYSMFPSVSYSC